MYIWTIQEFFKIAYYVPVQFLLVRESPTIKHRNSAKYLGNRCDIHWGCLESIASPVHEASYSKPLFQWRAYNLVFKPYPFSLYLSINEEQATSDVAKGYLWEQRLWELLKIHSGSTAAFMLPKGEIKSRKDVRLFEPRVFQALQLQFVVQIPCIFIGLNQSRNMDVTKPYDFWWLEGRRTFLSLNREQEKIMTSP